MKNRILMIILAAILMLTSSLALADTVITVTGSGETQVSADTAIVSLGVNARDKDVLAAQQKANGAIAVLGTFPESPYFSAAELHFAENLGKYPEEFPVLKGKMLVVSSDAHYLGDLREENESFMIPDEPYSGAFVRKNLIRILKGEA